MTNNISSFYESLFNLSRELPQRDAYLPYQGGQVLIIQNPESAKYILGANIANYPKHYDWFRQCIGISRFTENPPKWQPLKRVSQPFLNGFDRSLLLTIVREVVHEYKEQLNLEAEIYDEALVRKMTIDIFCRNFFGFSIEHLSLNFSAITELLALAVEHAFIKPGEVSGSVKKEVYQRIFKLKTEMLRDFKEFRDPKYHKSEFIQAILKAEQEGILIFEQELMFTFSVGIETTVHSLGWMLYLLAKHPDLQQTIKSEIAEKITENSPFEDYLNLVEVNNLIDWSLKRYPPTPCISRMAINADQVGDISIAENEAVVISLIGMLYDPNEDIEKWMLDRKQQLKHNLSFGYGQRICGGKQYATIELVYLVTTLMQEFDCILKKDEEIIFHWYAQLNRLGGHPIQLKKV